MGESRGLKVILNPITEIKITDLFRTTIEIITKNRAINSQPLLWVDGILFYVIDYDHKELTLSASRGIYYLDTVCYTESPFIEESKFNGYAVDVLDCTGHKTFEGLAKAIKDGIQ